MKNQLKSVELFLAVGVATTIALSGGGIINAGEYDNSTQEESATSNIYLLAQEAGTQEEGTQEPVTHEEGSEGGEGGEGGEAGTQEEGTHEEGTHEEGGEGGEGGEGV